MQKINYNSLILHIKKSVSLPEFVETLTDTSFKWNKEGESAICNCPMSWHNDRNASFHMTKMEDGTWLHHCFGCHAKGDVIRFFMDYTGEEDFKTALVNICKRMNIDIANVPIQSYNYMVRRVDKKKELENANIIVSNQCRLLLRRDFNKNKLWISSTYKRLNKALDEENLEEIEKIGYETSKKFVQ